MRFNLFYIVLSIFLLSCSDNKRCSVTEIVSDNNTLLVCDESEVGDNRDLPLSTLIDSLDIIRLDNRDEAFFKFQWAFFSDNYIAIKNGAGPVKLFDKDGNFINNIGDNGEGPGEYFGCYDILLDEKDSVIHLTKGSGNTILQYNLNGDYSKTIEFGDDLNKPRLFKNQDGTISLAHLCFNDWGGYFTTANFDQLNTDSIRYVYTRSISGNFLNENKESNGYNHEVWSYRNNKDFTFLQTMNDTLFNYNAIENTVNAVLTLKMSKEKKGNCFYVYNDLPNHYLMHVVGKNGFSILLEKETHYAYKVKVVNDYLGGIDAQSMCQDGYYFNIYEPDNLKDLLTEQIESGQCPPNQKQKLENLISTLDENDNCILLRGKLKQ